MVFGDEYVDVDPKHSLKTRIIGLKISVDNWNVAAVDTDKFTANWTDKRPNVQQHHDLDFILARFSYVDIPSKFGIIILGAPRRAPRPAPL
jgi:hypothetical protein